jgi:hypothetical protein
VRGKEGNLVADHQRRRFSPFSSLSFSSVSFSLSCLFFYCVIVKDFFLFIVCVILRVFPPLTFFLNIVI